MVDSTSALSYLRAAWDWLNDFFAIPIVQFLGVSLLTGLLLLIKVIRQYISKVLSWVREHLLVAQVYPLLGIASRNDLVQLREEITRGTKSSSEEENPKTRMIERLNLKFTLGEKIFKYLGRMQPTDIGNDNLNSLLQGPFCPKCNRNLLFVESGGLYNIRKFRVKCLTPQCNWAFPYAKDKYAAELDADELKREVYERLDAEFRRTERVEDTA
jgi:hypothetical protein